MEDRTREGSRVREGGRVGKQSERERVDTESQLKRGEQREKDR